MNIKSLFAAVSLFGFAGACHAGVGEIPSDENIWQAVDSLTAPVVHPKLEELKKIVPSMGSLIGTQWALGRGSLGNVGDAAFILKAEFLSAAQNPQLMQDLLDVEKELTSSKTAEMLSIAYSCLEQESEATRYIELSNSRKELEEFQLSKKYQAMAEKLKARYPREDVKEVVRELFPWFSPEYLKSQWSDVEPY